MSAFAVRCVLLSMVMSVAAQQIANFPDDEDCYVVRRGITQTSIVGGSADRAGYTTYQLSLEPSDPTGNIYAVYGDQEHTMLMPPAFQVSPPFGANFGGTNPAFWRIKAEAEYDSWLTAGITDGVDTGRLSSIGIDFDAWTVDSGLIADDGAVFWMDPTTATPGLSVVAQFTVPTGTAWQAMLSAQGKTGAGLTEFQTGDWNHRSQCYKVDATGAMGIQGCVLSSTDAPAPAVCKPPPANPKPKPTSDGERVATCPRTMLDCGEDTSSPRCSNETPVRRRCLQTRRPVTCHYFVTML
jgi:hypothetical protein